MSYDQIATGRVDSLSLNGSAVSRIRFGPQGPEGDSHCGFSRKLSGHDSDYIRTSNLKKKEDEVFNWRSWTAISQEEMSSVSQDLEVVIPQGCLLENMVVTGIPNFSKLPPTSRLVFPKHDQSELFDQHAVGQAILAVWEENSPCRHVGERLEKHYGEDGLMARFVAAAQGKRGVMGFVLSAGLVKVGDPIEVYPPMGGVNVLAEWNELVPT